MAPTNQLPLCVPRSIVHTSLDLCIRCSVLVVVQVQRVLLGLQSRLPRTPA
jgi:hypothetical protein